jgi:DNA-binding NtrC family response regulator
MKPDTRSATRRPRLLVVDDEPVNCRLVDAVFSAEGYEVAAVAGGREALAALAGGIPDAVLLDYHMPEMDGLAVLERIRALAPDLPVLMLTANSDVDVVIRAIRLGAYDYITKPINTDDVVLRVGRALERQGLVAQVDELRCRLAEGGALWRLLGPSGEMQRVVDRIRLVAKTNFTVLIEGESGTGKELVARALHEESARNRGAFIAIWTRKGGLQRRRGFEGRLATASRRRNDISRRSRQSTAAVADEAVAGHPGTRRPAVGVRSLDAD